MEEDTKSIESKLSPLLRMIAHDLKGLLGTPGLLISLAESARDDEDRVTTLASLREAFRALDRALDDVGDLGAVVGDPPASSPQPTDARALLIDVLALAQPAGVQRKIELVSEVAPGPWPAVVVDGKVLKRTFERLVYWGISKSANDARVVVSAAFENGAIRLRVPAGKGAPHAVPTVLERLQEIDRDTRELALALPLARETLERHGGSLTVHDGVLEAKIPAGN